MSANQNNRYLCNIIDKTIMLQKFIVDNFRSFGKEMALDLSASNGIRDNIGGAYTDIGNNKILNAVAFYGANSSGKTNFLQAIGTMRRIIVQSVKLNENDTLPFDPFLLSTEDTRPTKFEAVIFNTNDKSSYTYGFEYTRTSIVKEWLQVKSPRKSAKTLFNRVGDQIEKDPVNFSEGQNISVKLNKNRLFLSLVGQLGGTISNITISLFQNELRVISGIEDANYANYTRRLVHEDERYKLRAQEFLKNMNLGFNEFETKNVEFEKIAFPKGFPPELIEQLRGDSFIEVLSTHAIYDKSGNPVGQYKFDLDENESSGTIKIFNLTGPILETLENGWTLVIDELDSQMHPLISWRLIETFNNRDTNPNGAQLIFTTHDTHLLSNRLFRRDQIWFVQKDRAERSIIYPMMEATEKLGHAPRSDSNYQKNYIQGIYGAIPHLINESPNE